MANQIAPDGQIWVCGACGKRSKDLYGEQAVNHGWDESCMLNACLCYADDSLVIKNGRVTNAKAVEEQP